MAFSNPSRQEIERLLRDAKTVAVVGLSPKPDRASNDVASYLQERGYKIIPVNPKEDSILGEKSYPSLTDIPESVDIVDVFRRSETVPPIADEAIKIGAKALWLQEGVRHDESATKAQSAGLVVLQDICIKRVSQELT
jgi:predicted CoA-binding protein